MSTSQSLLKTGASVKVASFAVLDIINMNYALNQTRPKELAAQCAVVGLYDDRMLTSACAEFDEACGGMIKQLIESGDLSGKLGQTQMLFNLSGLKTSRVLVVGLGEQRKFDAAKYIKVNKDAQRALKTASAADAPNKKQYKN